MNEEVKNGRYVDALGTVNYKNGKLHREDGPAIEIQDGTIESYLDSIKGKIIKFCRVAMEWNKRKKDKDGTVYWYKDGELHREDGPALEWADGTKVWYLNGKLHREDGPAYESANGGKEWFLNGVLYTEEEFNQWLEKKLKATLEEKPSIKKVKV